MNTHSQKEPRSAAIIRATADALRSTGLTVLAFSAEVAEQYVDRVSPHERCVPLRDVNGSTDAVLKAQRANSQIIDRYITGVVKTFPADLEEPWIAALPDPFRTDLQRELASRCGLLAARKPVSPTDARRQTVNLAAMMREFAATTEALAPIMADGRIDAADHPHLVHALTESTALLGEIVSLQAQLTAALEDRTSVTPIRGRIA